MDVPALDSIQGDSRKIKQILYNLLSNAVKFSLDGGQVTVRARRVPRSEAVRRLSRDLAAPFRLPEHVRRVSPDQCHRHRYWNFSEGLMHLFTPFSQIDSGLSRRFEGTGLGLAMVKMFTELHGGTVAVESTESAGSSFTVWLPFRAAEGEEAEGIRFSPAPRLTEIEGGRTALVVEDDYKSADLIRLQLEAEGFNVLHAASAEAALVLPCNSRWHLSLST
jgi:CheY-like chemotaxis protein